MMAQVRMLVAETGSSKMELFLYNHRKATKQAVEHIVESPGVHESF